MTKRIFIATSLVSALTAAVIFRSPSRNPQSTSPRLCVEGLRAFLAQQDSLEDERQRQINKSERGVSKANFSQVYPAVGSKAALVLHGFIGSPAEVDSLAQALQAGGYTVLSPLLNGFGGSIPARNSAALSKWKENLKASWERLEECFPEGISLVGFSLGSGLILQGIFDSTMSKSVKSVVLISPYVEPALPAAKWINDFSIALSRNGKRPIFEKFRNTVNYEKDMINFNFLYSVSSNAELKTLMKRAAIYEAGMPLLAVNETLKLVEELSAISPSLTSSIPSFTIVTEADQSIDATKAIEFVKTHFVKPEFKIYPKADKIGHQLVYSDSGNDVLKMNESILEFLNRHN